MLRFTIRDMLWMTVVVAMGICWWMDDRHVVAAYHEDMGWADIARDLHSAYTKAGREIEIHHGEVVRVRPPLSK
jgi:hypothetical protein